MNRNDLEQFLATGNPPKGKGLFRSSSDWAALSDLMRNEILELRGVESPAASMSGSEIDRHRAEIAARKAASTAPVAKPAPVPAKPASTTAKPAIAVPAARPATVATTPVKPAGIITAEQFRASQAKPSMKRSDWATLTHPEKASFIRTGGKLVD